MAFFPELLQKNLIIYMETQKIPNSQNNHKKEKWELEESGSMALAAVTRTVGY